MTGMTKKITTLLIVLTSLAPTESVYANVMVPIFRSHISGAKEIIVGEVKHSDNGEFYFLVEESLKGTLIKNSMLILNADSRIAWPSAIGGPRKISPESFSKTLPKREWYEKRVILLGQSKDGMWISHCFDWSVWTSGKSPIQATDEEVPMQKLSLQELIEVIKVNLNKVPEEKE